MFLNDSDVSVIFNLLTLLRGIFFMKKIMLSVLLSALVVGSSQCAVDAVAPAMDSSGWCASLVPACVSNLSGDVIDSMKNHYYIWAATGLIVTGFTAAILYDVLKNDKKLLKKAEEYAQKFFNKTFKNHPYATVVVVAGGLLTLGSSYDLFLRGEDSLIRSVFASKSEDVADVESNKVDEQDADNDKVETVIVRDTDFDDSDNERCTRSGKRY
jgi:hypothetical protein